MVLEDQEEIMNVMLMTIKTADVIEKAQSAAMRAEDVKKIVAKSAAKKTKNLNVIYVIKTSENV